MTTHNRESLLIDNIKKENKIKKFKQILKDISFKNKILTSTLNEDLKIFSEMQISENIGRLYTFENNFENLNLVVKNIEQLKDLTTKYKKLYHIKLSCDFFVCSINDEIIIEQTKIDYDFDDLTQNDLYVICVKSKNIDFIINYFNEKKEQNKDEKLFWDNFYNKTKNLKLVPDEFKTKKMCEDYFNRDDDITCIPDKYLTKEMCMKFYLKHKSLYKISEKYLNQEICDEYFNLYGILRFIPDKFITQRMCDKIFNETKNFDEFPQQLITQKMYDEYYILTDNFHKIPDEFKTKEMCEEYFKKNLNIDIPEKYLTQEMCNEYFQFYRTIRFIPYKFITDKMIEKQII